MPWLKSDDDMPNNDKIWPLSDACYRLYEASRFYAARKLTDGHIPAERISSLTPKPATKPQIEALVRARLWHRLPGLSCKTCLEWRNKKEAAPLPHSGYIVHDYLQYNPSRIQWDRAEEQRKRAGQKGAQARWGDGDSHGEPDSEPHGEGHGGSHAVDPGNDAEPHGDSPSEMPGEMHAPYPGPRSPRPGSIDPVPPAREPEPEIPDAPPRADRLRDQARREGVRHVRGAAERIVAQARGRAAS